MKNDNLVKFLLTRQITYLNKESNILLF